MAAAGSKAAIAMLLLASFGRISEGVRRKAVDAPVEEEVDVMEVDAAVDPCAVVAGATTRDSEEFPSCKCSDSGGWWAGVSVYCGDEEIDGRKFNATEVLAKCAAPYCGKQASQTTTLSTTIDKSKTCAVVDGAVGRGSEDFPMCKCPHGQTVFCEDSQADGRKFNATSVFELPNCYDPYCAEEADVARTTTTTTTSTTTTSTTESTTSTTTFDMDTTVGVGLLFNEDEKFTYHEKTFKCCEHSQTGEVVIQDIADEVRPRVRSICLDATGCGCMFGDHWHSFEGDCIVKYSYLLEKTGVDNERLQAILHDKDPSLLETSASPRRRNKGR